MSHIAQVDIEIKSLDALKTACTRLGLAFLEGQQQFRYYRGQQNRCEHAIAVRDNERAYQMGIMRDGDKYALLWDSYMGGGGLVDVVGENACKLRQMYAIEEAKRFVPQGYGVEEYTLADGTIELRMTEQVSLGAGW